MNGETCSRELVMKIKRTLHSSSHTHTQETTRPPHWSMASGRMRNSMLHLTLSKTCNMSTCDLSVAVVWSTCSILYNSSSSQLKVSYKRFSPSPATAVQVWKIVLGVSAISWSLVSYQDELRRTVPNKGPLTCCATTTCLMWRAAMVASRVIAIGSFAAIRVSFHGV